MNLIRNNLPSFRLLALPILVVSLASAANSRQDPGPLTPPPKTDSQPAPPPPTTYHSPAPPQALRSPGDNPITNEPPSLPVDEIIKRFSERESEFKLERDNYTYTQTFSIQTIDEDNRPDGEHRMTS